MAPKRKQPLPPLDKVSLAEAIDAFLKAHPGSDMETIAKHVLFLKEHRGLTAEAVASIDDAMMKGLKALLALNMRTARTDDEIFTEDADVSPEVRERVRRAQQRGGHLRRVLALQDEDGNWSWARIQEILGHQEYETDAVRHSTNTIRQGAGMIAEHERILGLLGVSAPKVAAITDAALAAARAKEANEE